MAARARKATRATLRPGRRVERGRVEEDEGARTVSAVMMKTRRRARVMKTLVEMVRLPAKWICWHLGIALSQCCWFVYRRDSKEFEKFLGLLKQTET
jgi:hypothetical protein